MNWLTEVIRANKPWENCLALVLMMMALAASLFGVLTLLKVGELFSQEAAAWMQAVLTIVSLWIAWLAGGRQARLESMRQGAARVAHLRAVAEVVDRLARTGVRTADHLLASATPTLQVQLAARRLRPMKTAFAALEKVEWYSVPTAFISVYAINAMNYLDHCIVQTEEIASFKFEAGGLSEEQVKEVEIALKALAHYAKRVDGFLKEVDRVVENYDGHSSPELQPWDI